MKNLFWLIASIIDDMLKRRNFYARANRFLKKKIRELPGSKSNA